MEIEDTKFVKSVEAKAGGKSGTYWTVTWTDGKFDTLFDGAMKDKCEEAQAKQLAVHYTKEKKEGSKYFNIITLDLVRDVLPGPGEEPPPKAKPAPQELGMWWKELGEMIRAKDIDITKPAGKGMRTAYYAQMLSVLPIKIENES